MTLRMTGLFPQPEKVSSLLPGGICDGPGVAQDGREIPSGICPYRSGATGRPDGTAGLTRKLIAAVAR